MGTEQFKSKVIHETVNPKWNEVYEVGGGLPTFSSLLTWVLLPLFFHFFQCCRINFYTSECASCLRFQALIYDHTEKNLEIQLYDEDTDEDDFLGWCDRDAELTD